MKLSMQTRNALVGLIFVSPGIVGFAAFFLYPFILSIAFSLSELEIVTGGFELTFVGLENYDRALFVHESFVRLLVESIQLLLRDVPAVLVFSLFVAQLLNQQFRGRFLARAVFFLPVVFGSGVVLLAERYDYLIQVIGSDAMQEEALFSGAAIRELFYQLRFPEGLLDYISRAVQTIPEIIRASGIQILVLLSGLQAVPSSLYEAAAVEGATPWEEFWKITFPLLTPLVPTVVVYTIVDSFTRVNNPVIELIRTTAFGGMGYGTSSAMAWVYFLSTALLVGLLIAVISKWVIYQEE